MAEDVDCQEGCSTMGMAFLELPKFHKPPASSLWSSAIHVDPADSHWAMGFEWDAEGCAEGGCYPLCVECGDPERPVKTPNVDASRVACFPYQIYVADWCNTFSSEGRAYELYREKMLRRLQQAQVGALECFFSSGSCNETMTKADLCDPEAEPIELPHCALNGPTAVCPPEITEPIQPMDALCALVNELCGCPTGIGMIHAPSFLVGKWFDSNVLEVVDVDYNADGWFPGDTGGRRRVIIEKIGGNIVVPGCGYSGAGPEGQPDQEDAECLIWAYATSMVCLAVGEPVVYDAVKYEVNAYYAVAERVVAATFDPCCHAAIPVNICSKGCCC